MPAERSVFGHNAWNVPDGVSVRTFGDMLVLGIADGVSADDGAVLSDLTGVVVQALETVDGWIGPNRLEDSLLWDPRTISWLLGIVLPMVFLGVGTWCLLVGSLTNLGNARRALRYMDAEVARHLLWHRRAARRTRRRIVRTKRRLRRAVERIGRLGHILEADDGSGDRTARATAGLRKVERRRDMLHGHLSELEGALKTAIGEAAMAEAALLEFARDERHRNDSGDGASAVSWVVRATWPTRCWLWVCRVCGIPRAHTVGHPRNRKPEFVDKMQRLASCLVCYRLYYDKIRNILKKRGQGIVGDVWNGVWRAITRPRGAWAFAIGAGSVIAALVLPGVAVRLAADTVAALELNTGYWTAGRLAFPLGVVGGAYWWFRGYEHGRAVVWGAAAFTMLGLTTIEFTALKTDLGDVFDSQRVTVMQLVIVAMLFIGQEFGNRARDRQQKSTHDREEFKELLNKARQDLSNCLGKVPRLEGVPDGPCGDFKDSVKQAGARSANPKSRERVVVVLVKVLYVAVCVHFVEPALRGLWSSGLRVHGDALNVVVVTAAVVLLPVFSLWSAWNAAAKESSETKGGSNG